MTILSSTLNVQPLLALRDGLRPCFFHISAFKEHPGTLMHCWGINLFPVQMLRQPFRTVCPSQCHVLHVASLWMSHFSPRVQNHLFILSVLSQKCNGLHFGDSDKGHCTLLGSVTSGALLGAISGHVNFRKKLEHTRGSSSTLVLTLFSFFLKIMQSHCFSLCFSCLHQDTNS